MPLQLAAKRPILNDMLRIALRIGAMVMPAMLVCSTQGQTAKPLRMEILLEKEDHGKAVVMEPGHVFESGDRLRFHFTPSFGGTLFVMDRGTTGSYTLLFPKEDTGTNDRIEAGKAYMLPATDKGWFRITGPAGHDVVYFVVTSAKAGTTVTPASVPHLPPPQPPPPPAQQGEAPADMTPRCNDELFRARGDCIDLTAGPKAAGSQLPSNLSGMAPRDLFIIRKEKTTVVGSTEPLDNPTVYEFHLAHK